VSLTTAAVIPVRGHGELLRRCLAALADQVDPVTEVLVVDDSPDGSMAPINGVRLLRSGGRGPYAARNVAAAGTDADVLLFLDARSRPRPGWSGALSQCFVDPEVALAGSEVLVGGGPSIAAAASQRQQFARLQNYLGNPFFLPYLPTCNLAVRHADFTVVEGFSAVRSGGDADLCWKVLSRPGRRLHAVEEVLMDWEPRTSSRELLEQNFRYGRSTHALRVRWQEAGAPVPAPLPYWRLARRTLGRGVRATSALVRRDHDGLVQLLADSAQLSSDWGYRLAATSSSRA